MPIQLRRAAPVAAVFASVSMYFSACAGTPWTQEAPTALPILRDFPKSEYSGEQINGLFPDSIHIKTRTQSFNSYHYYLVHDGLIWYKAREGQGGPKKWTLFMRTGLPHNDRKRGFAAPPRIVEISADADELVALSDGGRFYRICFDWIFSRKNNYWYDVQGWPRERPLQLNDETAANIGWALGKRNSHVLYYEDIFGNQHHYGTMEIATTYLLASDGQELRFGDTGLPSDFSRNILGPDRGRFVASGISASASTIFLIGEGGELFTRLADFDTLGSDPMFFKYTYEPYRSPLPGTDYRSNFTEWALPSEDWRAQEPIPLSGKAALTRRITILQNGRGNGARELRVAGLDPEGTVGYWSKPIFGEAWTFVSAPLSLRPSDFLSAAVPAAENGAPPPGPRGEGLDRRLRGRLQRNRSIIPDWEFEIPDFNILEGACTLRILRNGEAATVLLHPVEVWTYLQRESPGRDGTPKTFFATLEIPPGAFDGLSESFRRELELHVEPFHRGLFKLIMEATTDYAILETRERSHRGYTLFLTRDGASAMLPETHRVNAVAELSEFRRYHSEDLILTGGPDFRRERYGEIREKLAANEALKAELEDRIAQYGRTMRRASRTRAAYKAFHLITHATLLYRIDFPKIYTLTRFGNAILETNGANIQLLSGTRIWLDRKLLELLDLRIGAYRALASTLAGGADRAALYDSFAETYRGYWELAGLPLWAEGSFLGTDGATLTARLNPEPLDREFPGWSLELGEEPAFTFLLETEGAAGIIAANPSRVQDLPGRLHLVAVGSGEEGKRIYERSIAPLLSERGIPVTVRRDGEILSVAPRGLFRRGPVFFSGTAVQDGFQLGAEGGAVYAPVAAEAGE